MAHSKEELIFAAMMQFGREVRRDAPMCPHSPEEASAGAHHHGHRGHRHHRHPMLSRERILTVLLRHEEGLRQKQLTEIMGVNASSMSEFITRLEDGGYITRSVDPADKRATLITLTEKGHARACELQDERREKMNYIFRNLTEDEKTELLRLLKKVLEPVTQESLLIPIERT